MWSHILPNLLNHVLGVCVCVCVKIQYVKCVLCALKLTLFELRLPEGTEGIYKEGNDDMSLVWLLIVKANMQSTP